MAKIDKGAQRIFFRALLAGSAVAALVLGGAAPAFATSWVNLTPRTCGAPTAKYVYIGATASGNVIHRHQNGGSITDFNFSDPVGKYHYTTAHFTAESTPRIGLNPGTLYSSSTGCDN